MIQRYHLDASPSFKILPTILLLMQTIMVSQGAIMVKNLAAKEPSAFSLDAYHKQYYLCLGAAAAVLKWYAIISFVYHMLQ